ncbi:hypothetical protein BJ138DRAFT_1128701 [Hygrophoropsis aurantiaca]|uniref:Uncharacterized protein n=1 Tax=Hygrophoropsis aurantiaca TaxID=72124 RepID=A0ACB8A4F2_9AGAM|nr:hypothetical protein BJ138DRAFT_1128701 [Hygrophoropsis aurantiaca]
MKKRRGGQGIQQTKDKPKLTSTQNSLLAPTRLNYHRTPSPIDLPAEILLIIFKFAYEQCRTPMSSTSPNHTTQWLNADPLSPSFFPHSIASVSSFWRDVMYMEPKFWTRFVVFVGHTNLDEVQTYLDWTKGQLLDIFIISKCNGGMPPLRERNLVESCMQVLSPHFHRCRTIRISVTLRSSLPRLDHHFCCAALDLTYLRIDCKINNAVSDSWSNDIAEWSFSSRGLEKLHLDSIYLREAWFRESRWLRILPILRKLTISSGSPSVGKGSTSDQTTLNHVLAVTRAPGQLSSLTIKGPVSIKYDRITGPYAYYITLKLDGMTQSSVQTFVNAYRPLNLHLRNLAPSFDFDILLGGPVRYSMLTLCNCPSFDDGVITWTIWKFYPQLQALNIIDCAKVTPAACKSLVENVYQSRVGATSKQPMRGWPSERTENPLKTLTVVGGARISAVDRRWFESRVLNFDWQAAMAGHKPSKYIDSDGE